jgi:hypothetical protein
MNSSGTQQFGGSRWLPSMMANAGCFARMWEAGRKANVTSSVISLEEGAIVSSRFLQRARACGGASPLRDSAKLSYTRVIGTPNHDPRGRLALMKWILISALSLRTIRKKGSEAVGAVTGAPERSAMSQSSGDYAARGERGEPRGRKSGADPGTTNPR